MYYEFVFENNAATIRVAGIGQIVVQQPFNPNGVESRPWADEEEARAWAEATHGMILAATDSLEPKEEPDVVEQTTEEEVPVVEAPNEGPVEEPASSVEPTAGQGE